LDKVALRRVSFRVLQFSPASVNPPLLHIHPFLIWRMDNGAVSDRSYMETQPHPTATAPRLRNYHAGLHRYESGTIKIFFRHELLNTDSLVRKLPTDGMAGVRFPPPRQYFSAIVTI
jgi:hypothetical protein